MEVTQDPKKKAPYRRRITEKRRDQNRAAQKLYRQKCKERLKGLEREVTALHTQERRQKQADSTPKAYSELLSGLAVEDTSVVDLDVDSHDEAPAVPLAANDTSFSELKHLLEGDDSPDIDELVEFALKEKPDIKRTLIAGLRVLKLEKETTSTLERIRRPISWATGGWQTLTSDNPPGAIYPLPNPSIDGIFMSRQSQIEVVFYNCMKIGISVEQLMKANCQSPWYSPWSMAGQSALTLERVPPDLIPTPAQMRYPHHPFIDTIPFPWFRERAIVLAAMDPPAYNRHELKRDILRGGMLVWRSRGKEEGLPWDRRSWEVQQWFWDKWSWLVEEQGRVEQQSRWWRSMRGD